MFEGFTAIRFCETCMVSREEDQLKFQESNFQLRTQEIFDYQVAEILKDPTKKKMYGIKDRCALHNTKYFHVTKNRTGDLMHDVPGMQIDNISSKYVIPT